MNEAITVGAVIAMVALSWRMYATHAKATGERIDRAGERIDKRIDRLASEVAGLREAVAGLGAKVDILLADRRQ